MHVEYHRVRQDFTRSAKSYALHADVQWAILEQLLDLASLYIPENATVLDVGCGPGWSRDAMGKKAVGRRIVGVDFSEAMCEEAYKHGLEAVCASAEQLPFESNSFDNVISSLCAQWLTQPQLFVREIARVLKPGGYAAIATLGPLTLYELRNTFGLYQEENRVMPFRNEKDWMYMARAEGLTVTHMHSSIWRYPYPSLTALLRTLRNVGATNKHPDRKRGLSGIELFAKVECAYEESYARPTGGIWASWQPLTLILKKH